MLHPGWVQTDMGGAGGRSADIDVDTSVQGIVQVFNKMDLSMTGKFVDWKGEEIPYWNWIKYFIENMIQELIKQSDMIQVILL